MRLSAGVVLLASVLAWAPAAADAPLKKAVVIERVVAVVNDAVILESEVAQRARPMLAEIEAIQDAADRQRQYKALLRQVLGDMVDEELELQAGTDAKLEVTDAEVDKALEEVKRQNKVTDEQLAEALLLQGYSIENYRKDVRRQILRLRAINILVRPRVSVSDEEVREHYDRMIGKSASVTEVHARHILIELPDRPTADEMNDARRRAGEFVARARAGEDFPTLARQHSDDVATKPQGGDLGWFKHGELPTEWEEILFAMSDGEVRGPIRGPKGLHVFQVSETKKESLRPFDEVKEQLRNQLFNESLEKHTKTWVEELHKKAHVEIKL